MESIDIEINYDDLQEEIERARMEPEPVKLYRTITCDASTQTDTYIPIHAHPELRPVMCDAACNFPLDTSEAIIGEHSYCLHRQIPLNDSYVEAEESSNDSQADSDHRLNCSVFKTVIVAVRSCVKLKKR